MGKKTKVDTDAAVPTKREQPLQAVLLADDFCDSFRPINIERPKMLCPLNNVAMIDYAIDFLAGAAGVEEIFVICVSDQVEEYLNEKQSHPSYSTPTASVQITIIKDSSITNAGDALREVDKRNLVQSDPFVLMFGDTVTNAADSLGRAIAAHKERKRKDSSAIMTLLMKEVGEAMITGNGIRPCADDLIVGLDPTQENRLLVYDNHCSSSNISIPCSFLTCHHPYIDLRTDLMDCGIDLCSPEVLARIADEFDYRDLRREFVANSVAEEEEGLQNKIHVHILNATTDYAARIRDFATYWTISQDLLKRWCYPVVPEQTGRYIQHRHYLYQECSTNKQLKCLNNAPFAINNIPEPIKTTQIGRSSKINGVGMIGRGCIVGEGCRVQGTILGNGCRLEDKVKISNSILWDGVIVEQGASIQCSILANGAMIRAGAVVQRGCIIGAGCIVGKGCVVPEFTRLTLAEEKNGDDFDDDWDDDEDDDDEEDSDFDDESKEGDSTNMDNEEPVSESDKENAEAGISSDLNVVGPDGKGRLWKPSPEDEDDDDYDHSTFPLTEMLKSQSIGYDPSELFMKRKIEQEDDNKDNFSDDREDDVDDDFVDPGSDIDELDDDDDDDDNNIMVSFDGLEPVIVGRQKGIDVIKELKAICLEYESTSPIENLAIELNSFKFSQNATYSDCVMAATLAILEQLPITKGISDGKLVADFKSYLDQWAPLLRKMSIGLEEEKAIVLALEQCAVEDDIYDVLGTGASFRFLLQTLHDEEIVSEDAILSWAADRRAMASESEVCFDKTINRTLVLFQLQPVQDFLEWLEEESEDESE